jgi:hypothetical protein
MPKEPLIIQMARELKIKTYWKGKKYDFTGDIEKVHNICKKRQKV